MKEELITTTMKKTLIFFAVICLVASDALAQLEKGNLMVGVTSTITLWGSWGSELGSGGFAKTKYKYGSESSDEYKSTIYNLLPKAGYLFTDNLVAGLEFVVSGRIEKDVDYEGKWSESLLGAGPFVRYYYPLDKFAPFVEAEALFGRYKDKWPTSGGSEYFEEKNSFILMNLFLGAAVPLGDKVTFDILAGYMHSSFDFSDEEDTEEYKEITGGFGIKMGFSIFLSVQ